MCGIFGYMGSQAIDVKKATDVIEHRGPDAEGFLHYFPKNRVLTTNSKEDHSDFRIALGFRRLAIIDLSKQSNQPFSIENNQFHITFNGEIYNYIELREELKMLGAKFHTESDTEVLLQAYITWGVDCFNKFNGMWAVSILDLKNQKVICSRDRFGIKPFFYYANDKNEIYWASEIKQFFEVGIPKEINENVVVDFIDKKVVDSTNETFFKNINRLSAGTYMEVDFSGKSLKITKNKYWELSIQPEFTNISYTEAKKKFKELFLDSVSLRYRSDVPVGACLSGGLDSSSIVSVAAHQHDLPIHTFTSRFDIQKFDESEYVDLLDKQFDKINTHYCQLTEDTFLEEMDKVLHHQDEPFGSMSILAQWEVMKLAKKSGVKVLLDGQGGDELLAGYRKFYAFYLKEKLVNRELYKFTRSVIQLMFNKEFNFFDFQQIGRYISSKRSFNYFSDKGKRLESTAVIGLSAASTLRERSKLDVERFSFPPLLRFEDRNSMASSIETRVPFMDFRLIEFLYSISADFKIRNGYTKAIMRDALDGILPKAIQKRKSKLGFETPQDMWINGNLREYFCKYFEKMENPYFNENEILKAFKAYPNNKISSELFFRIFCFDMWYQKNFAS